MFKCVTTATINSFKTSTHVLEQLLRSAKHQDMKIHFFKGLFSSFLAIDCNSIYNEPEINIYCFSEKEICGFCRIVRRCTVNQIFDPYF